MHYFVIADPSRCIGCYACVAGCVESHRRAGLQAYPRLYILHTPPLGTMPLQCRHCEAPACVAVCPVQAISFRDNAIHLNESLCIGCKMCALACPFGAIIPGGTPIPKPEFTTGQYTYVNSPYQADPMYLRQFALQERLSLLNWEVGQKTVAVKCDLCYFRDEGPACISACPHKALSLVDEHTSHPRQFVEQTKTAAIPEEVER
jgi:Fe-S-cluster-containing hydrogenase component 2